MWGHRYQTQSMDMSGCSTAAFEAWRIAGSEQGLGAVQVQAYTSQDEKHWFSTGSAVQLSGGETVFAPIVEFRRWVRLEATSLEQLSSGRLSLRVIRGKPDERRSGRGVGEGEIPPSTPPSPRPE